MKPPERILRRMLHIRKVRHTSWREHLATAIFILVAVLFNWRW